MLAPGGVHLALAYRSKEVAPVTAVRANGARAADVWCWPHCWAVRRAVRNVARCRGAAERGDERHAITMGDYSPLSNTGTLYSLAAAAKRLGASRDYATVAHCQLHDINWESVRDNKSKHDAGDRTVLCLQSKLADLLSVQEPKR